MSGMQITGWVLTFDVIFLVGGFVAGYALRPKIDIYIIGKFFGR